jgi:propanol-preferring alcohol dehydrogenase
LIPIPEALDSAATAPLLCAGATVYSGLKAANIQSGQVRRIDEPKLTDQWVVVPGSGGG